MSRRILPTLLCVLILLFLGASEGAPLTSEHTVRFRTSVGTEAMVSSTHYLATEAGVEVLKAGGNAADASAVIQFVLAVVQPQSTGIGGGCFILYYDAQSKKVVALDGREEAPNLFHGRMFCKNPDCMTNPQCDCSSGVLDDDSQVTGGHPVGVPGVIKATAQFLAKYGTMSLKEVLQPAIKFGRDGFPMYMKLYSEIVNNADRLKFFPASVKLYLDENDLTKPRVEIGETFYNPEIADTLELLAQEGPDLFYTGVIAQEIVETARQSVNPETGKYGVLAMEDMVGYIPVYREPVNVTYRGHLAFGFPPPASGGVTVLQMLNYIEGFDMKSYGPISVDGLHRMIDAQNIAFADRNKYIGDPDFVEVPTEALLDKEYMKNRRNQLSSPNFAIRTPVPAGNLGNKYAPTDNVYEFGTTHWSVVDGDGNAASFTSTIEQNLGSAVVVPGRGFLLNNELSDFESFETDQNGVPYANAPEGGKKLRKTALGADSKTYGGKRPRSSMSPTFIFNQTNGNALYFITGSPGGSSIPGAVFNVIVNTLEFNLDLQEATDLARALGKNGETSAESGIYEAENGAVLAGLTARGFNFSSPVPTTATYGRVQSILVGKDGYVYGAADVLREPQGSAGGF